MAHVLYSSGVKLEWDENLSVGSLIRTYHAGYWILERIEFREERKAPQHADPMWHPVPVEWSHDDMKEVPIYHSCQVLRDDGTPSKKARKSCAASYCRRITKDYMDAQLEREHTKADAKATAIAEFL